MDFEKEAAELCLSDFCGGAGSRCCARWANEMRKAYIAGLRRAAEIVESAPILVSSFNGYMPMEQALALLPKAIYSIRSEADRIEKEGKSNA